MNPFAPADMGNPARSTTMRIRLPATAALCALTIAVSSHAQPAPQRGEVVFTADFEGPDSPAGWPAGTILGPGYQSEHGIMIERPAGSPVGTTAVQRPLPLEEMRGCLVHFSGMVKAEDVSVKPQSWNGVKFMVIFETPGGKQYPQGQIEVGTFDWQRVVFPVRVPDDATSATLVLGLEAVTGKVWYDDFTFTIRKPPFVVVPRRQQTGPLYKGHSLPRLRGAVISPNVDEESLRLFGKEWNANVVRWQLVGWRPQGDKLDLDAYEAWLAEQLAKLDAGLPLCEKYGLYVVVDLHSAPSGPEASGKGLFTDKSCQDKFVEIWQRLARKYKSSKAVWGYDLVNEPIEGAVAEDLLDWEELAETTARAVRTIDPDHAIILEPGQGGNPYGLNRFKPVDVPGVVYSVHMYLPHAFTHQGVLGDKALRFVYPGVIDGKLWDKAQLEAALKPAIDFQKTYGVHLYLGEFSAIRWAPDNSAYRYLKDVIDLFEEHGWDWTYHGFREWTGWSVEHSNDEADGDRTATPNDRQKLLREWFGKNQEPAWTGGK